MYSLNWLKITDKVFDKIENKPGLYIISVLLKNGAYYAMFVGKSEHLQENVKRHFSDKENDQGLKDFLSKDLDIKVSYCYCDTDKLEGIKEYLIGILNPPFNLEQGSTDEKFKCSLPNTNKFQLINAKTAIKTR